MRVSICTDHKSIVRQIVWLNESRSGVYVGMYDERANPHTSYHADGRHHVKITQQRKELVIFEEQRKPITSISGNESIITHGAFYTDEIMDRLPQLDSKRKETAIVLIGASIFRHVGALAMNTFIVNRKYERQFLGAMYADYEMDHHELVTVNSFTLEHFPSHELSVVLYRVRPGESNMTYNFSGICLG